MLNSLTDIIARAVHGQAGEPTFTLAVKDLVTRALTSRSRNNQGADQHV
jgi:hypothetical protein